MPNSDGVKPHWQVMYEAATAETDREKLIDLINQVEEAMMLRTEELAHSSNHSEERNEMSQAVENLLVIKTEKLSYPRLK